MARVELYLTLPNSLNQTSTHSKRFLGSSARLKHFSLFGRAKIGASAELNSCFLFIFGTVKVFRKHYLSNIPHISMVYWLNKPRGMLGKHEKRTCIKFDNKIIKPFPVCWEFGLSTKW